MTAQPHPSNEPPKSARQEGTGVDAPLAAPELEAWLRGGQTLAPCPTLSDDLTRRLAFAADLLRSLPEARTGTGLVVDLPEQPRRWYALHGETTIGRAADCALPIDSPRLSRHHCRLYAHEGVWLVEDLASRNGVRVNGVPTTRACLRDGDIVEAGDAMLVFLHTGSDSAEA